MTSASTQTSVESATPATPSSCGESGNFTLNWDDEPVWTPSDPGSVLIPPVFSPYHHLFFSHGYGYVPPPEDPFFAVSEPRMLVFTGTKSNGTTDGPDHAGIIPGEIGAGPRNELDAFWFDAYSIWMGCENAGPASCTVRLTGYVWDSSMGQEKMVTEQMATIPPCIGLRDCHLSKINLNDNFRALTGVKFEAAVLGAPVTFYADDFAAAWWNNGCAAGLERQRSRKL
ncbi:hypothetical protein M501DRAFT_943430 [Patellaria atrata CBS 101060]|uniref:DUF7371 domain-containing protein n=1 Tax=Patellaria atrata CBS 101060 TaxID=1346257 RepID=A0A9P4S344_9PEZI|nr:hypothetical protein M501DRAFT_943430 [Patellaria atrata CBS 101060]